MRSKTIALAAVLLAGGLSPAFAQGGAPANQAAPTVTGAPSGTAAPTISSSDRNIHNPAINPSAAGTQMGKSAGSGSAALTKAEEHGGSREINANTHPLTAAKARKQLQKEGRNPPANTRRLPLQTRDAAAGR